MALTQKEKDFCRFYCICKNHREAAAKAGFVFPERAGLKLLEKDGVRDEIAMLSQDFKRMSDAADGLRRIAFGSVTDAVKLFLLNGEVPELENLDLFSVSEIKLQKTGATEIKFYDRIKALEALASIGETRAEDSAPFIDAILKGAEAIGDAARSDDNEL